MFLVLVSAKCTITLNGPPMILKIEESDWFLEINAVFDKVYKRSWRSKACIGKPDKELKAGCRV